MSKQIKHRHADLHGRFTAAYPYILLVLTQAFWSGNWVFGRAAANDVIPPAALAFGRWAIAALILAPFALPRLKGKWPVIRRHAKLLAFLGATGTGTFQVVTYAAMHYTSAINAVLMNAAGPIFIIATAWLLDGDKLTRRQLVGMLLSLVGIIIIATHGDLTELLRLQFNVGDLLILCTLPAWGLYCVLVRRAPKSLDTLGLLFTINIATLIFLAPIFAAEAIFLHPPHWSGQAAATVLYIGIFSSVLAYICWNTGIAMVGPNKAAFTSHLLPVFTIALAVVVLGEQFRPYHALAIVIVLFGVWLATSARRKVIIGPPD